VALDNGAVALVSRGPANPTPTLHRSTSRRPASAGSRHRLAPPNAFRPEFLARLAAASRDFPEAATTREARFAGPWHVERSRSGHWAVIRLGESLGRRARPFGVFEARELALAVAAVLPLLARGEAFLLSPTPHARGYPVHRRREFVGHLLRYEPDLVALLEVADGLAREPLSFAQLLAAAGPGAVATVSRLLAGPLAAAG
jgi:hypothetical protein